MRQGAFNQNSMESNEQGRQNAVEQGKGGRNSGYRSGRRRGNAHHEASSDSDCGNDNVPRRRTVCIRRRYGNCER